MVKSLPCSTGDSGLIPGQGTKLPRAAEQLSPCATTRESMGRNGRSHMPQPRCDTAELKKKKKPTRIIDLFYFHNPVLIFLLKNFKLHYIYIQILNYI